MKKSINGDFLDRFQGKVSQIQKDGHLGVVARTGKPIDKGILSSPNEIE
jgi:hypothetical protein